MKKQIKGQMSFMDMLIGSNSEECCGKDFSIPEKIEQRIKSIKNFSLVDCEKCECAFGSIMCFKNRGYQFDCHRHFVKGENGKPLRRLVKIKCLKELTEEPPILKKGCWLSTRDFGNNRMCATEECNGANNCRSCERYIRFYGYVEDLQSKTV